MSRIFAALRQFELDHSRLALKTATEAPPTGGTEVQQPETTPELLPGAWTTLEAEEILASLPLLSECIAAVSAKLPEVAPAAAAGESPKSPDLAPVEWVMPADSAMIPESAVIEWRPVQEPPPEQLEPVESIDLNSVDSARLVAMADERGLGAEKFRILASRLNNLRHSTKFKVLQVTSSVIGEGKTLVSANLALTLAKCPSQSVLLLEGNLHKPALSSIFGLSKHRGLNEWWTGSDPIRKFLLRAGETNLHLLPSVPVQHPASVLQSGRLTDAVAELSKQFDWVVIDAPPLLPMVDSNPWVRLADATLLVVRKGVATRTALRKALEAMNSSKLVGVVLNDAADFAQVNYCEQYYSGKPVKKNAGAKSNYGKGS
jgi:protein-tyrosine kinase